MATKKFNLGVIKVNGQVMVSDPSYGTLTWCNKVIINMQNGDYNCFTRIENEKMYGGRVKELTICHVDRKPFTALKHMMYFGSVGVDSGTCGIYDYNYFKETHSEDYAKDNWYNENVCNDFYQTKEQAYMMGNKGVHSCSGYGDGMYRVYVKKNENDLIHQITIKFD